MNSRCLVVALSLVTVSLSAMAPKSEKPFEPGLYVFTECGLKRVPGCANRQRANETEQPTVVKAPSRTASPAEPLTAGKLYSLAFGKKQ